MKKHLVLSLLSVLFSTFVAFAQSPTCEGAEYIATGYDEYLTAGTYWFYSTSFDFPFTINYIWDREKYKNYPYGSNMPECVVDFSCETMQYDDPVLYDVMKYAQDSLDKEWPVVGHLTFDPVTQNYTRSFSQDYRTALYMFGITNNTKIYLKITIFYDGWVQFNSNSPHAQCAGQGTNLEIGKSYNLVTADSSDLYMWPIAEWAHTNYQMIWEPENEDDELQLIEGEWCEVDRNIGRTVSNEHLFLEEYDGVFTWNSNKSLHETKEWGMSQEYVRFYADGPGKFSIRQLPTNINAYALLDSTVFATIDQDSRTITAVLPKGSDRNTAIKNAKITFEPINQTYSYNEDFTQINIDDDLKSSYKLNITVVDPGASNDASLKEITIDGTPLAGFKPDQYEYTIDWSVVPVVDATPTDPNYTGLNIKQPTDYTRYATIVVAAEDVYTTQTYIVNINLPAHTDATLRTIKANDVEISGFAPDIFHYEYNVPSADKIPAIVGTPNDRLAKAVNTYTASRTILPDSTVIVCTAEDGSSLRYVVVFDNYVSTDATLQSLKINGTLVNNFSPTTTQYNNISVSSFPPTLEPVPTHPKATVQFDEPILRGTRGNWSFTVTAEDGVTSLKYITNYTITASDAKLKSITIDGNEYADFDPDTYNYLIYVSTLPTNVQAEQSDPQATLEPSSALLSNGDMQYSFRVTATDTKTICTYSLVFHVAEQASDDATLSAILIDGNNIEGFNSATYSYELTVSAWPASVSGVANDPQATVADPTVKTIDNKRTYHIVVTAADGETTLTYDVVLQLLQLGHDASLSLISLDGGDNEMEGFQPNTYSYEFNDLEYLIDHDLIYVETNDVNATYSEEWVVIDNGEILNITVVAEDGITSQVYTLIFIKRTEVQPSHDATLSYLIVGSTTVTAFMPGDDANLVQVDELDHGNVQVVPNDPNAIVLIGWEENTLTVQITAQDGYTTQKYIFDFELPYVPEPSHDATLAVVLIGNDEQIDGPTPNYLYSFTVEALPVAVNYSTTDENATVRESWSDDYSSLTLIVTAEDKTTALTYYFLFEIQEVQLNDDATLAYISIFGEKYTDFELNRNNVITLNIEPAEEDIEIHPTDANATFDLQLVDNVYQLTITAEDGETQLTYYFIINVVKLSDDNTLAFITLDGANYEDFRVNQLDYYLTVATLPLVGAQPNSNDATIRISQPTEENPVAAIWVTAENGDLRTYTIYFTVVEKVDDDLIPLEVVFGNGFKGFIDGANRTIDVYYLASEPVPSTLRSWTAQDGAVVTSMQLTAANQLTVTSPVGSAVYAVNYQPVQSANLTLDQTYATSGDESYIKTAYFYTDSRGWRISKDLEEETNRRISRGKDRIYLFLQGGAALQLSTTTASRSVRISLNGTDITEKQTRYNEQLDAFYTAAQGELTYINGLTKNQPMMLEIESDNSTGDFAFKAIRLLADELPIDALESNLMESLTFDNNMIINPQGLELYVYTVTGQLLLSGTGDIDLSDMQRGVYIIRCNDRTTKFIKL